ncbi:MAG: septation protein IspZ, partial [Gammaproteobacteria bacterium]|nr:septation protein IspZ [Gammaproteobacteria bacterium]
MKLLVDFFPIILFFISYHQANFLVENTFIGSLLDPTKSELITATIVATGVAIVASFAQVTYHWIMTRKFEKMH